MLPCATCGDTANYECGCHQVRYCCIECQVENWTLHSDECSIDVKRKAEDEGSQDKKRRKTSKEYEYLISRNEDFLKGKTLETFLDVVAWLDKYQDLNQVPPSDNLPFDVDVPIFNKGVLDDFVQGELLIWNRIYKDAKKQKINILSPENYPEVLFHEWRPKILKKWKTYIKQKVDWYLEDMNKEEIRAYIKEHRNDAIEFYYKNVVKNTKKVNKINDQVKEVLRKQPWEIMGESLGTKFHRLAKKFENHMMKLEKTTDSMKEAPVDRSDIEERFDDLSDRKKQELIAEMRIYKASSGALDSGESHPLDTFISYTEETIGRYLNELDEEFSQEIDQVREKTLSFNELFNGIIFPLIKKYERKVQDDPFGDYGEHLWNIFEFEFQ